MWIAQFVQYIRWVFPGAAFIVMWPLTLVLTLWLTQRICAQRHDKWMELYGPAELKRRILDLQLRCAERGREITRLEKRAADLVAAGQVRADAEERAMRALVGVPELYQEEATGE